MARRTPVRLAGTAAALLCFWATAGRSVAETSLFIASDPDDPVWNGRVFELSEPNFSTYTHSVALNALAVSVSDVRTGAWSASVGFTVPDGTRLTPGVYENAVQASNQPLDRPTMSVWGPGATWCPHITGRFEVLAVDIVANEVRQFVATFEQHCDNPGVPAGAKLRGLVRFRAGDLACADAPDGTPCDDMDACTMAAECAAGQCVGAGAQVCVPDPSSCTSTCDPRTGICVPPSATRVTGAACDIGDACTTSERCQDGVCVSARFIKCPSNDDFCTDELCDPSVGCVSRPAAGVDECSPDEAPSALFLLRSEEGDPVGRGREFLLTRADTQIALDDHPDGLVVVTTAPRAAGPFLALYLGVSGGVLPGPRLQAGTRVGAFLLGLGNCGDQYITGAATILEASYSPGGRLLSLSLDYALKCWQSESGLSGLVRVRAGDPTCVEAADGTECDDLNACTPESFCRDGECVAPRVTACEPASPCQDAGVCLPDTGECLPAVQHPNGTSCVDEAACNPSGFCMEGECRPHQTPCDDDNLCTEDRCDAGQCVNTPGRCWLLDGKVTMQLNVDGHRCSCTEPVPVSPVVLNDDGSYRMPADDPQSCVQALEEGRWSQRSKGRLAFAPADGLTEAIHACVTRAFDVTGYTATGKLVRRGRTLKLRRVWQSSGQGGRWRHKVVSRLHSHPTDSVTAPTPLAPLPRTARCQAVLEPCLFRLAAFD